MSQSTGFSWPAFLDKYAIPESAFSEAYAASTDIERSRLKQNIAQLYAMAPCVGCTGTSLSRQWAAGFSSHVRTRTRDWVLILLSGSRSGPASMVAAIVPALTSGVPFVLPVFLDQPPWMPRLLVGLELCGLDTACVLAKRQLRTLLSRLPRMHAFGAVLDPDGLLEDMPTPGGWPGDTPLWQAPRHAKIGIWRDADTPWDFQALSWNHPGLRIEAWGSGPEKLPQDCHAMPGSWEEFCRQDFLAVGLPKARLCRRTRFPSCLALTPGQENCWLWAGISSDLFGTRQAALENTEPPAPQLHPGKTP